VQPFENSPQVLRNANAPHRTMYVLAFIITAIFILSQAPTPLYVRWQAEFGFSSTALAAIFSSYLTGLLFTLPISAQSVNRFGWQFVLLSGLFAAMLACVLFSVATGVAILLAGRFLTGVAVGTAMAAGMTGIVDVGGERHRRQAALIGSISIVLGAGLGPILAGGFALILPKPIVPIFMAEFAILTFAALAALTLQPHSANLKHRPQLRFPNVPKANRWDLTVGIAAFGPGLGGTAFMLSFGPSLLSRLLNMTNPLMAGGIACAMFMTALIAQFICRNVSVRLMLFAAIASTILSMAAIVTAVYGSSANVLVVAALLAGSGQGLGQLGGLTLIGLHVPDDHRAEANAAFTASSYLVSILLSVAAGPIIDRSGLSVGTILFAAVLTSFAILGGGIIVYANRKQQY
jgi:MFS family permease